MKTVFTVLSLLLVGTISITFMGKSSNHIAENSQVPTERLIYSGLEYNSSSFRTAPHSPVGDKHYKQSRHDEIIHSHDACNDFLKDILKKKGNRDLTIADIPESTFKKQLSALSAKNKKAARRALNHLSVNGTQSEVKKLPPVRTELEELRNEWKKASDMKDLPWEVQSAGDHARQLMLASLNSYLREGVPHQKVSWLVNVPDNAFGSHDVKLTIGKNIAAEFELVFGTSEPPQRGMIKMNNPSLKSVTVNYPRALHKAVFWSPFSSIGGPQWDFGWLGVYLLVYLPLMFVAKFVLRVP